jgi:hypothetical protein
VGKFAEECARSAVCCLCAELLRLLRGDRSSIEQARARPRPLPPLLSPPSAPSRPTQGGTVDPLAENNRERIYGENANLGSYENDCQSVSATATAA